MKCAWQCVHARLQAICHASMWRAVSTTGCQPCCVLVCVVTRSGGCWIRFGCLPSRVSGPQHRVMRRVRSCPALISPDYVRRLNGKVPQNAAYLSYRRGRPGLSYSYRRDFRLDGLIDIVRSLEVTVL